ncbi:MAG TPA: transglycosylase SLT domain-containing protein [Vicinamibacterales bacterium]|nr:transglycosylase SLT domain-containing protein [Vicinamibacterales bacterium]
MSPVRYARLVVLSLIAVVGMSSAAQAQIYAWRDHSGNLVLSDQPKSPSARTYAVPAAHTFRSTRAGAIRRAAGFETLIQDAASTQSLSPDLVRAVIQAESAFNPRARSVKGAMGLMQLMPDTAAAYGVDDPYDPAENIRAGAAYLKSLLARYDGDETLALAAYNAGPGAVDHYGGTVPPYRETKAYVARVRHAAAPLIPPTRVFKTVEIVDGHEVVRYSNKPTAGAKRVTAADRR